MGRDLGDNYVERFIGLKLKFSRAVEHEIVNRTFYRCGYTTLHHDTIHHQLASQ